MNTHIITEKVYLDCINIIQRNTLWQIQLRKIIWHGWPASDYIVLITCLLISKAWYINETNMHEIDTVGLLYICMPERGFDKHNFVYKLIIQVTKIGVSIVSVYHQITPNLLGTE